MEKIEFQKIPASNPPDSFGEYIIVSRYGGYRVFSYGEVHGHTGWRDEMENIADDDVLFWLNEIK